MRAKQLSDSVFLYRKKHLKFNVWYYCGYFAKSGYSFRI
jgi:hypothetical protein